MKKFWQGLKHFLNDNWLSRWEFVDRTSSKYVIIDGKRKDVSNYTELVVKGTGMERWGISDGTRLFMRSMKDEEKKNIEKRPILMIVESGAYWYECDKALKKFVGYIDIWPESSKKISEEIWEHKEDDSTFILRPDYDYDINEFSRYYTLNHSILPGINRMQFITLCQNTLRDIVKNDYYEGRLLDYHQMSIVCACYGSAYEYMIIPTENIIGKAEYVITD